MNISIKDIREEDWRMVKSEAAKNNLKIGEFLNKMLLEYKLKRNKESNCRKILHGRKFLTEKDANGIRDAMGDFRKEFEFR